MTNTALAVALARQALSITAAVIPPAAFSNARTAILDTVGVTLAGSLEQAPKTLMAVPGLADPGPSLIFGSARRTSALNAALINGTASHALDFDDVNIALGGHPSAAMLSALMALTGVVDCSGRDLLVAFIAGFETETRIARGVNFHHYEKGWHPTATLGIFGATAACCVLLRLSEAQTAIALSTAASMAAGLKANFGTMTKPLHVGQCARNGLMAALLAREGFTANVQAFEHRHGFLNLFNGVGNYHIDRMLIDWGMPFDIERPGVGIKLYPCCGSSHAAIDCMLDIAERHQLDVTQVVGVDARIHARRLAHIDNPEPRSGLEGKFSVQYCLARALLNRRVAMEHFEDTAVFDGRTRELMKNIDVHAYTNPPPDVGDHYAVELTVKLSTGDTITQQRLRPTGRSPEDPTPASRVLDKFRSCALLALEAPAITQVIEQFNSLENTKSVRDVIDTLQRVSLRD